MLQNKNTFKNYNSGSVDGFVLIISLMMMSLIMLMILAITSQIRVETRASENNKALSQARMSALVSAKIALATLQKTTGPDTRITAPSQSTNDSDIKWVGVWDSEKPLSDLNNPLDFSSQYYDYDNRKRNYFKQWLVSGDKTSFDDQSVGSSVSLAEQEVEKVLLEKTDSHETRYAYFIEDESQKINIAFKEPSNDIKNLLLPNDPGLETLEGLDKFEQIVPNLHKVIHKNQMNYLMDGIDSKEAWENYDDSFTVYSHGLFTDSKIGGLRKDLDSFFQMSPSAGLPQNLPGYRYTSDGSNIRRIINLPDYTPIYGDGTGVSKAPTWELFRSFYNTTKGGPITPSVKTEDSYGMGPVIQRAAISFYPKLEGNKFRLYIDMRLVLWNPYNVTLDAKEYEYVFYFPAAPTGHSADFRLIPMFYDGTTEHSMADMIDNPIIMNKIYDPAYHYNARPFTFRIRPTVFEPGDFRIFSVSDTEDGSAYTGQNYLDNDNLTGNSVYLESLDDLPAGAAGFGYKLNVGARYWTAAMGIGTKLKEIGAPYTDITQCYSAAWQDAYIKVANNIFSQKAVSTTIPDTSEEKVRSLHFTVARSDGSNPKYNWISWSNMTARGMRGNHPYTRTGLNANWYNEAVVMQEPADSRFAYSGLTQNTSYGVDSGITRFVLYDMPDSTYKVPSLAFLQHCSFDPTFNSPSHLIGNSRAQVRLIDKASVYLSAGPSGTIRYSPAIDYSYLMNEALWDSYFLSTIRNNGTYDLLNPSYKALNTSIDESMSTITSPFDEMAAHVVNKNALNVNSLSVDAWKSLLSMANNTKYNPQTGSSGSALQNPFLRSFTTIEDSSNTLDAYWNGYRQLSDQEIEDLAKEIVVQIKGRGPFLSISDFVNRRIEDSTYGDAGAIHQAIANTTINQKVAAMGEIAAELLNKFRIFLDVLEDRHLMEGINGWVTQADVLQKIGNSLTARGDTFKIHAYGETTKLNGDKTTAQCELVVQRMPEYVDDSNSADESPRTFSHASEEYADNPNFSEINKTFGRRYQIISFQWK